MPSCDPLAPVKILFIGRSVATLGNLVFRPRELLNPEPTPLQTMYNSLRSGYGNKLFPLRSLLRGFWWSVELSFGNTMAAKWELKKIKSGGSTNR